MEYVRHVNHSLSCHLSIMPKSKKKLGEQKKGVKGRIVNIEPNGMGNRLFELGFLQGALVEVMHVGLFGGNPLAIKVNGATIAMRKNEANHIEIDLDVSSLKSGKTLSRE